MLINADDSATLSSYLMGFHRAHGGKVQRLYRSPSSDYEPDKAYLRRQIAAAIGTVGEVRD